MRLLHTSDWHLGRSLETVSLVEHQRDFLVWLADLAARAVVDAIARQRRRATTGRSPRSTPSGCSRPGWSSWSASAPSILISGNHDSPTRLGFGGPLLERSASTSARPSHDIDRPVELIGADGTVVARLRPALPRARGGPRQPRRREVPRGRPHRGHGPGAGRPRRPARRSGRAGQPPPRVPSCCRTPSSAAAQSSDSERDVSVGGIADAPASGLPRASTTSRSATCTVRRRSPTTAARSSATAALRWPTPSPRRQHVKSVTIVDIDAGRHGRRPSRCRFRCRAAPDDHRRPRQPARGSRRWPSSRTAGSGRSSRTPDVPRTPWSGCARASRTPSRCRGWRAGMGSRWRRVDRRVDPATADPVDVVLSFIEHVTSTPATGAGAACSPRRPSSASASAEVSA